MIDSRVGFEVTKGSAVIFIIAPEKFAKHWVQWLIPDRPEIREKVREMERSGNIKLTNFVFN